MKRAVVALAFVTALAGALSCGRPCRGVEVKPVALQCADGATFTGEIHFDDAPTFETFLSSDECLPDALDEERAAIVDSVDFLNDVVFVAVDDRFGDANRCIETREPEEVAVCDNGLRVAFADRISDDEACNGRWTVAFALPRAEMRAAIQDF